MAEGDLTTRRIYWVCALCPFCYIVYGLRVGMAGATDANTDTEVEALIQYAFAALLTVGLQFLCLVSNLVPFYS